MNKLYITIFITALAFIGFAQDTSGQKSTRNMLVFGPKVGLNYSNVYDTQGDSYTTDPKLGFAGGLFLAVPIGTFSGIQPEVLFSQKGFKAQGSILGSGYSLTRTTSYIDVPIYLMLKPAPFLTVLVGPQYSYLVKQRDVFENGTTSIAQELEFENDNVRKNILSVTGGLDINIKHVVLGLRAGLDVSNNRGDGTSNTPRYKNSWFQATLGFRIY